MLHPARSCSSVSSASFSAFSLDDGIIYVSFTTFPNIKNSCLQGKSLSCPKQPELQSKETVLHGVPWIKYLLFFFFFCLQKYLPEIQWENQSQRNHFHQLSLLGLTQSQENIPSISGHVHKPVIHLPPQVPSGRVRGTNFQQQSKISGLGPEPLVTAVLAQKQVLAMSCFPARLDVIKDEGV